MIAYLYYDLLNLYGESGNLKVIIKALESENIPYEVTYLSIGDKFNLEIFDLIIVSNGTEKNLKLVLNDILKYRIQIKKLIKKGVFFLVTGNALDLFGQKIILEDERCLKGLNIFDFYVFESSKRTIKDCILFDQNSNNYIIGFQNQNTKMLNKCYPLFENLFDDDNYESIHIKNFYGVKLLGPLLARNPAFARNFIQALVLKKFPFKNNLNLKMDLEFKAYENRFSLVNKTRIKI